MPHAAAIGLVIGLLLSAVPAEATAQDLHLVVDGVDEPERLAEALSGDLGRVVILGAGPPPLLRVSLGSGGEATLEYTSPEGARLVRRARISPRGPAAIEELTLLGSNLVRDQTPAPIIEATALPDPTPRPEEVVAPPAEPAAESTPTSESTSLDPRDASFALSRPLRLGVEAVFGVNVRDSNAEPIFHLGLSLFYTVHESLSVGVTRLTVGAGYSSVEGALLAFSAAPALELFTFVDPHVQLWGQVGASLQGRTPTNLGGDAFQAAPFLAAGARFWVVPWFTLGIQLAVHLTVTDAFRMGSLDLPQWSTPGTVGVSAEFHFDP